MRYFVFLRILEKEISDLLDIAIYTLNPQEKWGAHITLAGPYQSKKNLPREREFEQKVSIIGASQFRNETQNTVFLRVGSSNLRSAWDKPDYPFNPHLTIYDGFDHNLGDMLYTSLVQIRPFLFFHTSRLEVVRSPRGEPRLPMAPTIEFKKSYGLSASNFDEAWALSTEDRVSLAVSAVKRAKDFNLFNRIDDIG